MAGENGNYWPGFVDALSNMVMAMIFVVMTFVVVVFNAMQNNAKALESKVKAQTQVIVSDKKTISELLIENKILKNSSSSDGKCATPITAAASKVDSVMTDPPSIVTDEKFASTTTSTGPSPMVVSGTKDYITVTYMNGAVALNTVAKTILDHTVAPILASAATEKADIVSEIGGANGATDAQRLAYFRSLELRNYLLAKGWKAKNISVRLVPRAKDEGAPKAYLRLAPQ